MNRRANHTKFLSAGCLLVMLLAPNGVVRAVDVAYIGPDLGNWNVPANWSGGFGPDASFGQAAVINNATVVLNQHTRAEPFGPDVNVAGLRLATNPGGFGGLRVTDNGMLPIVAAIGEPGSIQVGVNASGSGTLVILGGGGVRGVALTCGGGQGSSIALGDSSGRTATLHVQQTADLQRLTTIIGPNVDFSVGGNLTLGSVGTLIAQIRHSSLHSPLKAAGVAALGGTLRTEFSGVTPALGNTWSIIDADTITGAFASLDTSAAPALPAGQAYLLRQADGGINGRLVRLSVELLAPADFDRDGDVDGDDFDIFAACAAGPALPYSSACALPTAANGHIAADFDQDSDADADDFGVVQRCFSGANLPPDPACAE
jgi:hypothetical protein